MKLKLLICIFSLGFSLTLHAYPSCTETQIEVDDPKLKKIFIKKLSEKETKIRFLYAGEAVIANPFFCYTRDSFVECLGDDDSGHLILKKDNLRIKRLTIRTSDDTHHSIKESPKSFKMKAISCSEIP